MAAARGRPSGLPVSFRAGSLTRVQSVSSFLARTGTVYGTNRKETIMGKENPSPRPRHSNRGGRHQ